jgi:hypothetical protein
MEIGKGGLATRNHQLHKSLANVFGDWLLVSLSPIFGHNSMVLIPSLLARTATEWQPTWLASYARRDFGRSFDHGTTMRRTAFLGLR